MRDIHAEVTNQIVADMEAGRLPWEKPWRSEGGAAALGMPMNAATGRGYRGMNILQLWAAGFRLGTDDLRFLTFKQALDLGGNVKKGAKGFKVHFYKQIEVEGQPDETGETTSKNIPFLREFTVFHVSDVEGCQGLKAWEAREAARLPEDAAEFIQALGASVIHGGDRAFYQTATDRVGMPKPQDFKTLEGYKATLYHELTHWTGHKSRMARDLSGMFGSSAYAREELIAELGGAFLCAEFGLPYTTQHAAYLQSWIKVLQHDKRAIWQAASAAQKAVDWIREKVAAGDAPRPAGLPVPVEVVAPAAPVAVPAMPGNALAPAGAARALVDRKALLGAVAVAASITQKSTIPILECVRIASDGNALMLQATNLDVYGFETVPAACHGAFDVAVPVKALLNLLRKSDCLDVGLVARDGGLMVCLPGGNVTLPGFDVADWPDPEGLHDSKPHAMQVDIASLLQGLGVVSHAMSNEEARYYLNGVFLHAKGSGLRMVATDGHRLAMRDIEAEGIKGFPSVIVPAVTVKLMGKAWGKSPQGHASLKTGTRWIEVEHSNLRLVSKLIDGTFPDYARVIPSKPLHKVAVDGLALKAAIARVTVVSEIKGKGVKLTFSDGKLQIECKSDSGATATADLPCKARFADGLTQLECGVNSVYLADICTQAGTGLELGFVDGASPILCKATAAQSLIVLMPLRA